MLFQRSYKKAVHEVREKRARKDDGPCAHSIVQNDMDMHSTRVADIKDVMVLYDRYAPSLYGMITQVVICPNCAEHVLKQSFLISGCSSSGTQLSLIPLLNTAFRFILESCSSDELPKIKAAIVELRTEMRNAIKLKGKHMSTKGVRGIRSKVKLDTE